MKRTYILFFTVIYTLFCFSAMPNYSNSMAAFAEEAVNNNWIGEYNTVSQNEHGVIRLENIYDPSLQTKETISPHYYANGAPYVTNQFDKSYNCTALIPVEPNTTYTIGLVPSVNGVVLPWGAAANGWFLYDKDENYLGEKGRGGTIITGPHAAYLRFNYITGIAPFVRLDGLNARCMIVKGNILPQKYQAYGETPGEDLLYKFDYSDEKGIEFTFSDGNLLIGYGYNNASDAVIVLNAGRANGIIDFAQMLLKPKGVSIDKLETVSLTTVWINDTDMHSPYQFLANQNADGYYKDANNTGFVGGNHTLDQMGNDFKTASSRYIFYYADGKPVTDGSGWCNHFEIRWANDVQAYNTVKEGGGGRSCLTEYHDMIFDGVKFTEEIRLVPTEDITMQLWYGLQFVSFGDAYTHVCFADGKNRQTYLHTDKDIMSGNAVTSGMLAWGKEHAVEVTVDTNYDLGKRIFLSEKESSGAFISSGSGKGYFTIIKGNVLMSAGTNYFLRGSYRFFPSLLDSEE